MRGNLMLPYGRLDLRLHFSMGSSCVVMLLCVLLDNLFLSKVYFFDVLQVPCEGGHCSADNGQPEECTHSSHSHLLHHTRHCAAGSLLSPRHCGPAGADLHGLIAHSLPVPPRQGRPAVTVCSSDITHL